MQENPDLWIPDDFFHAYMFRWLLNMHIWEEGQPKGFPSLWHTCFLFLEVAGSLVPTATSHLFFLLFISSLRVQTWWMNKCSTASFLGMWIFDGSFLKTRETKTKEAFKLKVLKSQKEAAKNIGGVFMRRRGKIKTYLERVEKIWREVICGQLQYLPFWEGEIKIRLKASIVFIA